LRLASDWRPDGPRLPLEFVRDSDDSDELALVLHAPAPPVPTRWALLDTADLADAREMLRAREKIRPAWPQWVGSLPDPVPPGLPAATPAAVVAGIAAWMRAHDVEAAVWTALPAKFAGVSERAPSAHEALAYLDGLAGDARARKRTCAGYRATSARCTAASSRNGWGGRRQAGRSELLRPW